MKKIMIILFVFLFVTPVWGSELYRMWYQVTIDWKNDRSGKNPEIKPWRSVVDIFVSLEECDKELRKQTQDEMKRMVIVKSRKGFIKMKNSRKVKMVKGYKINDITMQAICFPVGKGPR